jgi:hypothetical protein
MIESNDIGCLEREKAYIEIKYKQSLKGRSDDVYVQVIDVPLQESVLPESCSSSASGRTR